MTALLMTVVLFRYDGVLHWFVIPVFFYGVVVGRDVVDWVCGRLDTFDPLGILAVGIYLRGFLAAILRVATDNWLGYVVHPSDWRPWVGYAALSTTLGYVLMRIVARYVLTLPARTPDRVRTLGKSRFYIGLSFLVCVGVTANVIVLLLFDGIGGYMSAFEAREGFRDLGLLLVFAEPLPILLALGYVVSQQGRQRQPPWFSIITTLAVIFILTMLVGGLRGSRSNVVWTLFVSLGMIHTCLRPVPRKLIFAGILALLPFIYFYSFYKHHGADGFQRALASANARDQMAYSAAGEGRWFARFVGGGTDTFTLYRIFRADSDYKFTLGLTYIEALTRFVPSFIWGGERPPGVIKAGTDVLHGPGAWPRVRTSLVWGLHGEGLLNFGPIGAIAAYVIPGMIIGAIWHRMRVWPRFDARRLLLPLMVLFLIIIEGSSSRQLPFLLVKNGFVLVLCIYFGSNGVRLSQLEYDRASENTAH
jgi:hypothetical protein